ncbi:type IV secretory system conjugative DNA transfer family protein [Actinomycetospora soli]|uniref:type IV secretory system conjugative DNA transfer family protein n=1 Tax=Actinomycetospora soli TaxID=2893887 RepID=UPI001E2D3BDF|nr:TraM recognition domain-containing protein [Actinomycetospora soli]MCD2190974.1 TraM recognition domain-containing protein [Actinomycetospora soli]
MTTPPEDDTRPRATRRRAAVLAGRVRFAAARTGPRARRGAVRAGHLVVGVLTAAAVAAVLSMLVAGRAWASHPRWSTWASWVADRLGRWQVLATTAVLGLLDVTLFDPFTLPGALAAGPGLVVWGTRAGRLVYPHTVRGRVRTRYGLTGWANHWDLHRHVSAHAVRAVAATMRPTLATELPDPDANPDAEDIDVGQRLAATAWRRMAVERLPVAECGTWLGRSAVGPVWGSDCYAALRDVVGLVAPPQTAKTALMGHHVIDFPGAVFTTSTKPDMYAHTAALRARKACSGRVEVFNPEGLGDVDSTLSWPLVRGCAQPSVAAERAGALVGATSAAGGEDGTFWLDSAAKVLRCLLLAADLGGRDMRAVQLWVASPTEAWDAVQLLRHHRAVVPHGWAADLEQILATDAKRTRESILLTLSQAVAFMADPTVAAAVCPDGEVPTFDVGRFLADRGTLYLILSERPHASVAPLAAAFTTYVFEEAKRLAATRAHGRLDTPLGLVLDEAALTTPVPLDRWVADAGGRGIHIIWSCQSPSQLAQRWGHDGADTIWNATNAKLVFGGLSLDSDLEAISRLCGDYRDQVDRGDGQLGYERVRVLPVDRLRTLPQVRRGDGRLVMFGLLLHRATPATITRVTPVWERSDVQAAGAPVPVAPINEVLRPADPDQPQLDDPSADPTDLAGPDDDGDARG